MRIGIDLGGTKIEAAALGRTADRSCWRRRIATPAGDYAATIVAVKGLVESAEAEIGCRASVGVGIPGALSPATGLVKNANSTCLIGRPSTAISWRRSTDPCDLPTMPIASLCPRRPTARPKAPRSCSASFSAPASAAESSSHGRLLTGPNAIAGEWGHSPLPWPRDDERPGPLCYCGKRGCIESFLSGPALEPRDHRRDRRRPPSPARSPQRAAQGEAAARGAVRALYRPAGTQPCHRDQPARSRSHRAGRRRRTDRRLYRAVPRRWSAYVFSDTVVTTRLLPPRWGDSSGVRGAAWLWPLDEEA